MSTWAGNLVKLARLRTGLSQRELARRARTSQPAIAAYESGRKDPSLDTLARLVRAAGLDLRIALETYDDHDDWVRHYEADLPPEVLERARRIDRALMDRARERRAAS